MQIGRAALGARQAESALRYAADTLERIDAASGESEAVSALAEASLAELRAGRIIDVEGSTLSRTEVELCALATLLG